MMLIKARMRFGMLEYSTFDDYEWRPALFSASAGGRRDKQFVMTCLERAPLSERAVEFALQKGSLVA